MQIAEKAGTEPIAVVGMGCRYPGGVDNPDQYWELLKDGRSGIVRVPPERWDADTYYTDDHTVPGTICNREGGFLTTWQPDEFDAEFFAISPREAAAMDPQQRLLLEVACEALEDAGIPTHGDPGHPNRGLRRPDRLRLHAHTVGRVGSRRTSTPTSRPETRRTSRRDGWRTSSAPAVRHWSSTRRARRL